MNATLSRLITTIALAATALAGACGAERTLVLKPNDAVMPLTNGEDPGQAVGRCVRFGPSGPVSTPCPVGTEAFFGKVKTTESSKPSSYVQGVFTRGADADRATETVVAYELVTYSSDFIPFKTKLKSKDVTALKAVCGGPRGDDYVIVRSFEGCGIVRAGDRRQAWRWTISDLAAEGTTIGQPQGFWAQAPDDGPAQAATCAAKRVVQVEVMSLARACERYQAQLFPRSDDPTAPSPTQAAQR